MLLPNLYRLCFGGNESKAMWFKSLFPLILFSFAGDFGAGSLEYRAIVGGIRPYGANSWGSFIS